jgi:hypothetical protein
MYEISPPMASRGETVTSAPPLTIGEMFVSDPVKWSFDAARRVYTSARPPPTHGETRDARRKCSSALPCAARVVRSPAPAREPKPPTRVERSGVQ